MGGDHMTIHGKEITLFPGRTPDAPLVVLHTDGEEAEKIVRLAREQTTEDFALAAIAGVDWDRDMTPWPAEAVFKGGAAYPGGGPAYLEELTGVLLPALEQELGAAPRARYLAGYSLAGLFALYGALESTAFSRCASVSGSLWYPGWMEWLEGRLRGPLPERVYCSVGDREARTRNSKLQTVEENTRRTAELLAADGVQARFELNEGNHFQQPEERTARALVWLVGE